MLKIVVVEIASTNEVAKLVTFRIDVVS